MSMKERKIFFTRNGEYTLWEMLIALPEAFLSELYFYVFEKKWVDSAPARTEEYPSFLYRVFERLSEPQNTEFYEEIKNRFDNCDKPKSDFNGVMYYVKGTSLDLKSAVANVQEMIDKVRDFEIEGLSIEAFYYTEMNGINNVVDIRFTSERSEYYKQNDNRQYLNTEIRVYLDLNLAIMTNFSQYTHSDKEKSGFIEEVILCVSSHTGSIEPLKLSDQSLRNLLVMDESHLPSKLKFNIDGRIKIAVEISQPSGFLETVYQDEINYFYKKYPITMLRVKISDGEEEKFLHLDGPAGKIIARQQTIDVSDVDNFIKKLSVLLEFDYLNHSQEKEIRAIAQRNLMATQSQKELYVSSCIKVVEDSIAKLIKDDTNLLIKVIRNAFFYCIKEGIVLKGEAITHPLEDTTVKWLAKIAGKTNQQINELFSYLLEVSQDNSSELQNLLVALDDAIHQPRMVLDVSGL